MAVFSIIKLSELEGAKRIDAEYYKPEYFALDNILSQFKYETIQQNSFFVKKGIFDISPSFYTEMGIPFVRVQNIRNGFLEEAELVFIPEDIHQQENKTELESYDLVLSKVGTIGEVAFIPSKFNRVNFSQNVIGIKINKHKIFPGYVLAFFLSKFGQKQLERAQMPQVQSKLELEPVKTLKVIKLGEDVEKNIHRLILEAENFYNKSHFLYSQAETILLEELGLKNFKPKYKKTYTANLSDAFFAHRIDAEYFQPAYEEVIEKIKKYPNGFSKLFMLVENVKPDFDPTKYPDKIFSYIELADIDTSIGVIQSSTNITGEEAPSRARRILKKNDVIVSSVEGSLEKVALVDKQFEGSLASTGFFQFRPKNIFPEVLLILSKTPIIQNQLKKECGGTILTAVPKEALRKVIIPILPPPTQQKIASLVQQSHEARRKAKELLEEAKKKVEDAIEKGK